MANRVFIGRLSSRADERDIEHFFRGYGRLRDIVMKAGFGFVEFESSRDADDAIYDLNGKELCGERVTLEFSRRGPRGGGGGGYDRDRYDDRDRRDRPGSRYGPPMQTRHRLIVENLSTRVSWQDLKDMMRSAGEVTFADAHKQRKNEGVICFACRDDLLRAIDKFDGKDVNGRRLKLIDDSEDKRSRSRSRRRSNSRSRSRSRSRSHHSRSKSRSRSRSKERSRSRSRSASKERSRSRSRSADRKSRSPSAEAKRERSRSPTP